VQFHNNFFVLEKIPGPHSQSWVFYLEPELN